MADNEKERKLYNYILVGAGIAAFLVGLKTTYDYFSDQSAFNRRFKPEVIECPYQRGKMEELADMRWSHYSRGYGDGDRKLSDFENTSALAEVGLTPHAKWSCGDLKKYVDLYAPIKQR